MKQLQEKRKSLKVIIAIALLTALLCMPGIVYYIKQKDFVDLLYTLMVPLFVLLIPIVLFRKLIRWYIGLIGIFILLAPIASFPIVYFGIPVRKDILLITFNTTYQEASELMRGYLPIFGLIYIGYIVVTIIAIRWIPKKISFRRATMVSAIALFSLVGITAARYGVPRLSQNLISMAYAYYPFHLVYTSYQFYKEEALTRHSEKNIQHSFYSDVEKDTISQRQIYVLIIGESSRYYNWEINGYDRPTSPRLMKRQNLLVYNDAAASGGLTELAVPQMITGVTADDYSEHLRQAGITRLFQQAGFKTYWISNQTDEGNIRMHASVTDSVIWMQNAIGSNKHMHYDMDLVNSMRAILKESDDNCLFVIHTLGSHYRYTYRYPKSFERFTPVGDESSSIPTDVSQKPQLINAYDNTILYTDAVLDSVIDVLGEYRCVSSMIYASDHGENLFDDARNLALHIPRTPTKYLTHIPFFIYCSDEYKLHYPLKWQELSQHVNSKISNNQIFETLSDMAGIRYKGQNIENSIASPDFRDSPQKVLGPDNLIFEYSELK